MRRSTKRSGLTLLEVLCVMAILIILLSAVYPSIEGMYGHVRLTAGADQVRSVFAEVRSHAIEEGQPYRFAVVSGQDRFRAAPDRSEYWEGGDAPSGGGSAGSSTYLVLEGQLPKTVIFHVSQGSESGSGWTRVATFLPDGTCGEDTEMRLESPGCRPISFRVRSLTGAVRVRSVPVSEGH